VWNTISVPGGTLSNRFNGRIVNFQMWDEVLGDFGVAYPSWQLLFVAGGAQTL
jgi:hypothetical protein